MEGHVEMKENETEPTATHERIPMRDYKIPSIYFNLYHLTSLLFAITVTIASQQSIGYGEKTHEKALFSIMLIGLGHIGFIATQWIIVVTSRNKEGEVRCNTAS